MNHFMQNQRTPGNKIIIHLISIDADAFSFYNRNDLIAIIFIP